MKKVTKLSKLRKMGKSKLVAKLKKHKSLEEAAKSLECSRPTLYVCRKELGII